MARSVMSLDVYLKVKVNNDFITRKPDDVLDYHDEIKITLFVIAISFTFKICESVYGF